jgi:predicted RNA-binding Zn-ribbon protein involved in translation (DUF1610 family)
MKLGSLLGQVLFLYISLVRTMLEGVRSYMPVNDTTSIGSISHSKEARLRLAKQSINFVCPKCGPIRKICERMKAAKEKVKKEGNVLYMK